MVTITGILDRADFKPFLRDIEYAIGEINLLNTFWSQMYLSIIQRVIENGFQIADVLIVHIQSNPLNSDTG